MKMRTCLALLLLLGPALPARAAAAQPPRRFSKTVVFRKGGWLIPGRDQFVKLARVAEQNIGGVAVTVKAYEAPGEVIVDAEGRRAEPSVRRRPGVALYAVRNYAVYEAGGRVFAHRVDLVPVFVTRGRNYWEKSYAGAMYCVYYSDEDGDGVFESRYAGPVPPRDLPAWVRRSG